MKAALICLLALLPHAVAFSELIPNENFPVTYENTFWMNCKTVENANNVQEVQLENEKANEKIQEAKQSLVIASLVYKVQSSLLGYSGPLIYPLSGNQCSVSAVQALRSGVKALKITSEEIDEELGKLEFEIGENFTGPGAVELIEAKEAANYEGELGKMIKNVEIGISKSIGEIYKQNPGKAVEETHKIIKTKGTAEELQKYLKKIKKSQEELKTLEEELQSGLSEEIENVENYLKELKNEEIDKLGLFEVQQLKLAPQEKITIEYSTSSSPAGLYKESETLLTKAKNLQKTTKYFKSRGRTAKKIETLSSALQKVELAKNTAEKSIKKTNEILLQLEQKAQERIESAEKIEKPAGKKIVEETIAKLKLTGSEFNRISELSKFIKTLTNLEKIYSKELSEKEKLDLKITIRELETIAKNAEKQGVSGASEISESLRQTYALIDGTPDAGELVTLEIQANDDKNALYKLIENKYGYLRELYEKATELEEQMAFTVEESAKIEDLRETFSGTGQLAKNIEQIDEVEKTLKNLIAKAAPSREVSSPQTTNEEIAEENKIEQEAQIDYQTVLKNFEEIQQLGLKAFYSDKKTKKSIEQTNFENILKKAQKKTKEIEKKPTQENVAELKKYNGEMDEIINEMQAKAGTEIAIAEQRGASEVELSGITAKWTDGKYTEALQQAQNLNKEYKQSEKITGQVTQNEDPKIWAIGASLVIILIGAAYLLYVKKNDEPS